MAETNTENATSYIGADQKHFETSNVQETMSNVGTNSSDVHNNEKISGEGSDYEDPKASTGLKRKASTTSLTEVKRKRSTEENLEESGLDLEDPKEKIKNLMSYMDTLKAECVLKDSQIENLKTELTKKEEEIKKLLATNNRYKSGLACIICTSYLANPCTINCGHSFCYSCLREWLRMNRENGSKCPSCRANITTLPVLSYVLKDQVESLVEQLPSEEKDNVLETLKREEQIYKQISDHWDGVFDQSIRPLLDEEDGVLRCPTCGWEVEGSTCGKCGQHIDIRDKDDNFLRDNDDGDDNDNNNSEIDNVNELYDSNDSFIDNRSDISDLVGNDESYIIDNEDGEQISVNESYVIDESDDESSLQKRPSNTIVINDSSSELGEEQSEHQKRKKKGVIVISSDEDEEESLHSNTSPSLSPYEENNEEENDEEENNEVENYGVMNPYESDEESFQENIESFIVDSSEISFAVESSEVSFAVESSEISFAVEGSEVEGEYTERKSEDIHDDEEQ